MSYQIADEPTPHEDLRNFVVHPTMPLLAAMWCGAWLAFPWFVLNAYAMGSPTKRRELQLCLLAVGGTVALAFTVFGLVDAGVIESVVALRIALLGITAWKLGMAYWISTVQSRTFHVYTYYGGEVRQAYYVIVVGSTVRGFVLGLSDNPLWHVIVSGAW